MYKIVFKNSYSGIEATLYKRLTFLFIPFWEEVETVFSTWQQSSKDSVFERVEEWLQINKNSEFIIENKVK